MNETYLGKSRTLCSMWILCLCVAMGITLALNAASPSFVYKELKYLYNDGHYIASVAKNIVQGHGVSYWNGLEYRLLDPEISTGPVVFLPLAAALFAGVDEWQAFNAVPILVNVCLFALLLLRLSRSLPFRTFSSLSIAATVVSLSFQRWQWHLPLGEVPAALCLLLAISYFAESTDSTRHQRNLFIAGIFWCLALLSKMLVLLTLPAFLLLLVMRTPYRQRLLAWTAGAALILTSYFLFCLVTMPQPDIQELAGRTLYYIFFNFNFGITDWYTVRAEENHSSIESTWQYLIYNVKNLPAISDNIGIIKSSIMVLASPVAILAAYRLKAPKEHALFVIFAATVCVMTWYFLIGQHGSRYFFVAGYISLWCLLLLTTLNNLKHTKAAFIINTVITLAFLPLGRAWIFPPITSFSKIQEMKELAGAVQENEIKNILGSMTLFHGYPEIAYYLDESRYLIFPAYLDKKAELVSANGCPMWTEKDASASEGLHTHPLLSCLKNHPDATLVYRWKNHDTGYFLKKVPDYELGNYTQDCKTILYQSPHYVLQRCRKSTLSRIINHRSEGRIIVEDALQTPPGTFHSPSIDHSTTYPVYAIAQ